MHSYKAWESAKILKLIDNLLKSVEVIRPIQSIMQEPIPFDD